MAPGAGWYADPAGSGQMRYWDGEAWSNATSAIPQARQSPASEESVAMVGALSEVMESLASTGGAGVSAGPNRPLGSYAMTVGVATPPSSTVPKPAGISRWKIIVAAVVVLGVAVAVAVPTALGSHKKSALSSAFTRSLLTAQAVTSIAGQPYSVTPLKAQGSQGSDSAQCMTLSNAAGAQSKDTATAARGFAAANGNQMVVEELSSNPAYPRAMDQVQSAMKSCSATSFDGTVSVNFVPIPTPQIDGSDQVLAAELTGQVAGTTLVLDMAVARFGDNIIFVMVGGVNPAQSQQSLLDSVLTQAAYAARPAFAKS